MPDGDIYELIVGTNQDGAKLVNRFIYRQNGTDGPTPVPGALNNAWQGTIMPLLRACYSVQAAVESLRIRQAPPAIGGGYLYTIDEEGDISGDALPPNSCAIIALYAAPGGPKTRGRTHISAYPETEHSDGLVNTFMLGKLDTLANALIADLPPVGGDPGFTLGLYDNLGNFHNYIEAQVRSHLYTLRSRRMASP